VRVGEATIASRFSFIESTGQIQSVKVSTLTYRDKNLNVRWQRGRARARASIPIDSLNTLSPG
jgi:hypothetical protein